MTITEKRSRARVDGFLCARDGKMFNGRGEEILLCGMGIGNWLLPEGYMWKFGEPYDRPRTIEALVRELCGSAFAGYFWKRFREEYITEADVRAMAEHGFNSVRLPVNWRVVMEDEPGIHWKEDGFALIDHFLDLCETYKLYVCLDLHGAPGGQTGSNIDDSVDNIPRLLTDTVSDSREKTLALWKEFARRYRDRWIVGMYDLLNEPARSPKPGLPELDHELLRENLRQFYRDCVAEIRNIDPVHMISIESDVWASRADFFTEKFDDNMCAHFHRYWCPPRRFMYDEFLAKREALSMTLYLGETGENSMLWFAAMYPLAAELDIGCNVWPWKKLATDSSPCSIRPPKLWKKIVDYTRGGDRPSYTEAQEAFDEYLDNIRFENCDFVENVIPSIFRRPGCEFKACDYVSANENVRLVDGTGAVCSDWDKTLTEFNGGGVAEYLLYADGESGVIAFTSDFHGATVELAVDGETLLRTTVSGPRELSAAVPAGHDGTLRISCVKGSFTVASIAWKRG
ncbi:MAG: glycoside hydrolase family 5 protein [Eubacteriales bacterium]